MSTFLLGLTRTWVLGINQDISENPIFFIFKVKFSLKQKICEQHFYLSFRS